MLYEAETYMVSANATTRRNMSTADKEITSGNHQLFVVSTGFSVIALFAA